MSAPENPRRSFGVVVYVAEAGVVRFYLVRRLYQATDPMPVA
jgi:hypothetical protein